MDTNENNTQGRASYTDAERRELVEEFHASGMKQVDFCREWNINPKTLARWLRLERQDSDVSFCEVELGASARIQCVAIWGMSGVLLRDRCSQTASQRVTRC